MSVQAQPTGRGAAQISRFVESLQEPKTLHISVTRILAALGVKRSSMADIIGVHRNTLRNPASERLQGRLRDVVRVVSAAAALSGDLDKAIYWFCNEPIADYAHKTAAQLVASGHADAAMSYLNDLENGANG